MKRSGVIHRDRVPFLSLPRHPEQITLLQRQTQTELITSTTDTRVRLAIRANLHTLK